MREPVQTIFAGSSATELADSVEAAVRRGALEPGDRLPSVRRLAAELGVSPTTAAAAIRRLRERGLVVSRERSGVEVSSRPPLRLAGAERPQPADVADLATGNPDPALLPDLHAALATLARLPPRLYGENPVLPELAAPALEDFRRDGIAAGDLTVCSGALDALERVLAANLRAGDAVAVEDPGYHALLDLLRGMGLVPVGVPIDEAGMQPAALADALAGGVAAVAITPRGQNPTGAALDEARADALRAVLAPHPDVLVVEDDHLGAVAGAPAHTLSDGRRRWAVVRSVSKALGPDLRLALLTADERTLSRVEGRLALGAGWVSTLIQRLTASVWDDARVRRAAATYARRRSALIDALGEHGIAASARSGFNVWIPVDDETTAVGSLLAAGYAVQPGSRSRLESPPGIRVTASTLGSEEARRVAAAVAAATLRRVKRARTG